MMKFKILNDDIGGRFKAGEIGDLDLGLRPNWHNKYHCALNLGAVEGPGLFSEEERNKTKTYVRLFLFHFWEVEPILHPYVVTIAEESVKMMNFASRVETLRSRQYIASCTQEMLEDEPELIEDIKQVMGDQYISDDDFAEQMNEAIFRQIIKRLS